jgi:hypothetical protein
MQISKAMELMLNEKHGQSGQWGAKEAVLNGQKINQVAQVNKLLSGGNFKYENAEKVYDSDPRPAECFVAQISYTLLNGFILTTDGRVFSWGGVTFCLGRDLDLVNDDKANGAAQ